MNWVTVHPSHAIERIRIEVAYKETLPSKVLDGAKRKFEARRNDLRFQYAQDRQSFIVGPQPLGQLPPAGGWQAFRASPSGEIIEAIQFLAEACVYESSDYRNWSTAKARMLSVASELLTSALGVVNVQSVSLDYTDRFVSRNVAALTDPFELLTAEWTSIVPNSAATVGQLWHVHRGWFENTEHGSYLINQNVDVQDGFSQDGRASRSIQIWTRVQQSQVSETFDIQGFEVCLERLHFESKLKFADLLRPEAQQMVGLNV